MAGPHIGTGATVSHSTVTALSTAAVRQIDEDGLEVPIVDVSHLGSTEWRDKTVGDLSEPGSVTLEILADTDTRYTPGYNTLGTLTVTDRMLPGETAAGFISGNAWVSAASKTTPLEEVVVWTVTMQWETGPAFTAPVTT